MPRLTRIEIEPADMEQCPTCRHAHPKGLGLLVCGCRDCSILFGSVAYEWLAPPYQERYRELHAQMEVTR